MKSAVAELIGEFFAKGGKITKCPDGIGLGDPALRQWQLVGSVKQFSERNRQNCNAVVDALALAKGPLTVLGIEVVTGIPFTSLRSVMPLLEREGAITVSGTRPRFYQIAATGTGALTGGPASESAAVSCAGVHCCAAARPGKAA